MKEFARLFHARKKIAMPHGSRPAVAKAAALSEVQISRWGTAVDGVLKLPTIYECERAARALKVSPAWLAFGQGAQALDIAENQAALAKLIETNPELVPILDSYVKALPEDRAILAAMSKKIAPPKDAKVLPAESRARRRNTRADFPVFSLTTVKPRPKAKALPHYLNVAAGPSRVLEACHDLGYVREWAGTLHSGTVLGDSMLDTVRPGDRIALEPYNGGEGVKLSRLPGNLQNPVQVIKQHVPEDSICIVSLDTDPDDVTLKRIKYQAHADGSWYMKIEADNPDVSVFGHERSYTVSRKDEVTFWARMVGFIGPRAD